MILVRRIPSLILTLLLVSFMSFMLTTLLPGDPALAIVGPSASEEQLAEVRSDLRLDDPLLVRYMNWAGNAATGDLGRSYITGQDVSQAISERLSVTVEIAAVATALALTFAIPLATLSAYRARGKFDRVVTLITFGLLSLPNFILALFLIRIFSIELGWFPSTGWTDLGEDPIENLRSIFLPVITLALAEIAMFTRILRSDMITSLQQDYVAVARLKGLTVMRILVRHCLRNSMLPLLTVVGLSVGTLMGGTVIVETVFALPGLGKLMIDAISQRDLMVVQGVVVLAATSYVVINFLVEVGYTLADPRLRSTR